MAVLAIPYPKQRFLEPIRIALLLYGVAPEDAAEEEELTEADEPHEAEPPQAPTLTRRVRHQVRGRTTDDEAINANVGGKTSLQPRPRPRSSASWQLQAS